MSHTLVKFEVAGTYGLIVIPASAPPELRELWQTGRCPVCGAHLFFDRAIRPANVGASVIRADHKGNCPVASMSMPANRNRTRKEKTIIP
jgi:hypothetical protein